MADNGRQDPAGNAGESLRARYEHRAKSMLDRRLGLEPIWQALSDNFSPLRYRGRGQGAGGGQGGENNPIGNSRHAQHAKIYNATPKVVLRTLASGLHAGLSSPARPWFRLLPPDREMVEFGPVKLWLAQVEASMRRIFAKSNAYRALPFLYGEWGLFGTMGAVVFEDPETVIRVEAMTAGTYALAENRYGRVDTMLRDRVMTVRQMVQEFERDRLPLSVLNALKSGRIEQRFTVQHLITPGDYGTGIPFKSCYWMQGSDKGDEFLAERSFQSDPLLTARWDEVPGDVYGTDCPGMMALSSAKQLQKEEVNIARNNERDSDPPMQAPITLAKTGLTLMPGEVNYVPDTSTTGGIRSVYDRTSNSEGTRKTKEELQVELKQVFFYDLFLLLSNDQRNQRATAEEIRALYDEKVTGLGPVLEQGNPMLAKFIDRTFAIGVERSQPIWRGVLDGEPLFPPPPRELAEMELNVDFISPLQQAQRAGALASIERFMTFCTQLATADPGVLDKVDVDQAVDEYGDALYVPPSMVRPDDKVEEIRAQRAQAQQAQQMASMAPALKQGADAAQSLAETVPQEGSLLSNAIQNIGSGAGGMAGLTGGGNGA